MDSDLKIFLVAATIGLLLVGGCVGSCVIGIPITYSDGERVGVVTKVSNKGLFWKTWEAQMNLGGMKAGGDHGNMVPNIWEFSATDLAVVDSLQRAAETQQPVRVSYHQPWVLSVSQGESDYLAVRVQPVAP